MPRPWGCLVGGRASRGGERQWIPGRLRRRSVMAGDGACSGEAERPRRARLEAGGVSGPLTPAAQPGSRPLIVSLALLAGLLSATAIASGSGTGTAVHLYRPFAGAAIARGVRIGRTSAGSCWTTSLSDARTDAFRCLVGNDIYDPCFAREPAASSSFVLCPLYTPGARVLRIDLTGKLPPGSRSGDPTRYPPWAVQTRTGGWCTLVTGATGTIEGLPISYGCGGGASLLGTIERSPGGWTVFFAASARATRTPLVSLRAAWW
jgi:hypothetical protein